MAKKTRLIVPSGWGTERWVGDMFDSVFTERGGRNLFQLVLGPEDTVVFEGGTDINPNFYGQRSISWTQRPDTQRDAKEAALMRRAITAGANLLGICRGAQFITAMAGGELIQHVDNHTGSNGHMMTTTGFGGEIIRTNSLHHQMMFPFGLPEDEFKILSHVPNALSNEYLIGADEGEEDVKEFLPKNFVEPEVVWYPKVRGLAIQGHPEMVGHGYNPLRMRSNSFTDFVVYSRKLVKEFILNDIPA